MLVLDCAHHFSQFPAQSTAAQLAERFCEWQHSCKEGPKGNNEIGYRGVGTCKYSYSRYSQDAKVLCLYMIRKI